MTPLARAALALAVVGATTPLPALAARVATSGGRVTIYVADDEIGEAIGAAIRETVVAGTLTDAFGRPLVSAVPEGDVPARTWWLDVSPPVRPAALAAALVVARRGTPGGALWSDVESALPDTANGTRVRVRLAAPACALGARLAAWSPPSSVAGRPIAPFAELREGWYRRRPDASAPPLLDEILVVVTASPPSPGRNEIAVRVPAVGERTDVTVAYRLSVTLTGENADPDLTRALRAILSSSAFDPLLPATERATWVVDLDAPAPGDENERSSHARNVAVARGAAGLEETIARRARLLLADAGFRLLPETAQGVDAVITIDHAVLLEQGPATDARLAATVATWTVLAAGRVSEAGENVGGRLAAPATLFRLDDAPAR